ncbi:hypothetical protein CBER1_00852 [Cercospora berteroae]|uniref:FAM192A/Fyv6 N-terminal domain-containing protein n=1 Tax=Cercospora berteroae TaxID=357750 RepID=A0A2S6C1U8_9PEZI|nr:hypothetical protein CBER1_00852 [Cercospora berteroae]
MSRFVAAGADGEPTEQDEKWLAAQQAIEATRSKPKIEPGQQEGGKSLYETLQANKAAKQEAFEQSIRLGNQFQSLDEDDVEFLDSVLESTRAQEAAVKRETKEQLDAFRQQQLEAERRLAKSGSANSPGPGTDAAEQTEWTVGRKRKKNPKDVLGGVKLRKQTSTEDKKPVIAEKRAQTPESFRKSEESPREQDLAGAVVPPKPDAEQDHAQPTAATSSMPSTGGLGLGAYSSDEDE